MREGGGEGGGGDDDLVISQTEESTPIEGANATVHISFGQGASNITLYAALRCNWWNPPVLIWRWRGQASTPDMYTHNRTRPGNPFYGIPVGRGQRVA